MTKSLRWCFWWLGLLLAACTAANGDAGETAVTPTTAYTIDAATGLPFNPDTILTDTPFIVEGEVINVSTIPQDAPLFKIRTPNGVTFQIISQPLSDIYRADGTQLDSSSYRNGLRIRAVVYQGDAVGLLGEPVLSSENLTILLSEE